MSNNISIDLEKAQQKIDELKKVKKSFTALKSGGSFGTTVTTSDLTKLNFYKDKNKSCDSSAENMNLLSQELYSVLEQAEELVQRSIDYIVAQKELFEQADARR